MEISGRTLVAYFYLYNHQIRQYFRERPITSITYSTVKKFYIDRISVNNGVGAVCVRRFSHTSTEKCRTVPVKSHT